LKKKVQEKDDDVVGHNDNVNKEMVLHSTFNQKKAGIK
jgi:hypothetical protein